MSIISGSMPEFNGVFVEAARRNLESLGAIGEASKGRDRRKSLLWAFVYAVKSDMSMIELEGDAALDVAEWVFLGWVGSPPDFFVGAVSSSDDVWEELCCGELDAEGARAHFLDLWEFIKFFPGRELLPGALEKADRVPLSLGKLGRTRGYVRFVSLSGHLQVLMGGKPIFLPVVSVGKLLGRSSMTVSLYRRWAMRHGFLTLVEPARHLEGKAASFRFSVWMFPELGV